MSNKEKNIIIIVLSLIVSLFLWNWGYKTGQRSVTVDCDTIRVVDTVQIRDTFPWYVERLDTIIYRDTIKITDTVEVLKDYTAIHYYETTWNDSSIFVSNNIAISENKILDQVFKYKITKEPIVIKNTYFNKYLYLTGTASAIPGYSSLGVSFASERSLIGIEYSPFGNVLSVTGGFRVAKFTSR